MRCKKSHTPAIIVPRRKFNTNEKVFYKNYKNNTTTREPGTIKELIGNIIYTVQGKKFIHRRHINQLQKRITDEPIETPQIEEDLYDTFDLQIPQAEQEEPKLKIKQKAPPHFIIDPKRKNTKIHKRRKSWSRILKNNLAGRGITHLSPHNEIVHLPYIAVATNTRAD